MSDLQTGGDTAGEFKKKDQHHIVNSYFTFSKAYLAHTIMPSCLSLFEYRMQGQK